MAEAIHHSGSVVTARIESASSVAARLPSLSGVVAVPRLKGWVERSLEELATRIRGEVVRALTSRESRLQSLQIELKGLMREHAPFKTPRAAAEICKAWCVEHRHDAAALEVLCDHEGAVLDSSVVSLVLDSCEKFGEMGRSRVLSALASRLLPIGQIQTHADAASRLLRAARELPWEAPGHEDIARAVTELERDLFYETTAQEREGLERVLGVSVAQLVDEYANHPRVAVVEEVAKRCERADVLKTISERALAVHTIDTRMSCRLVAALAGNLCTPVEVLHPFASPEMWTHGEQERTALGALLSRSMGTPLRPVQSTADMAP